MAFIGNNVQTQGFTPAIDYFNGDGTTVTFTLSRPVVSVAQMIVAIDNVIQNPSSAFTVSGNEITFTSAPLSGTNNIWVEYTSLITTYNAISQDPSVIGDITATGGYLSTGDFGNTFTDGTIVDYVTGMARITTGASDGITFYNGGTASRTALMTMSSGGTLSLNSTGNFGANEKLFINGDTLGGTSGNTSYLQSMRSPDVTNTTTYSFFNYRFTNGTTHSSSELRLQRKVDVTDQGYIGFRDQTCLTVGYGNTERMRIDANGYVTTPYQPAFFAVSVSGSASNANGGPIYTSVSYSRGPSNGGYNTSTGYFTAPVTGWYSFAWCYLYQTMTAGAQIDDGFRVNSSFYFGGNRYLNNTPVSFGDSYVAVKGAVSIKMSAGDTFTPASSTSGGGSWTYYNASNWGFLSGALIG